MATINKNIFLFLIFGVVVYSLFAYGFLPMGSAVHPDMKEDFVVNSTAIYIHIFAAVLALALGPFQLSAAFRKKHMNLHRWMGRVYLGVGVLVGGFSGLYLAQFAFGGIVSQAGFTFLGLLWLYTGLRAYLFARQGKIAEHQKWMIRNYALTFAAVTLRIYLPLSMVSGFDFAVVYPLIAWLCWVPNLLIAEGYFVRKLNQSS